MAARGTEAHSVTKLFDTTVNSNLLTGGTDNNNARHAKQDSREDLDETCTDPDKQGAKEGRTGFNSESNNAANYDNNVTKPALDAAV